MKMQKQLHVSANDFNGALGELRPQHNGSRREKNKEI